VAKAIEIAKRTRTIVVQNIAFAIGVKLLVMVLGIFDIASLWAAVFADTGVTLLAVLNSMRILIKK
jgi:Cd2+/Zn2+-exporting ATPase